MLVAESFVTDRLITTSPAMKNRILRLLPPAELARLLPHLQRVRLTARQLVLRAEAAIPGAWFPEAGVVSMINTLRDGTRIEVGLVGCEGFVGVPLVLGVADSTLDAMVQVEGSALRISAAALQTAMVEAPALMPLLMRYIDTFQMMMAQLVACSGRHQIEQRLARWLLITHDRVSGDSFAMTQQFLSNILGVRRPGVTLAVGTLVRAGLIAHGNGTISVLNRPALEEVSCECYEHVQRRFSWVMGKHDKHETPARSLTNRQ